LFVQSFASGSSGNCYFVSCGDTLILLDAGISCRGITGALRLNRYSPTDIQGILLTHEHSDHVKGVEVFAKRSKAKVFATPDTWSAIQRLGIEVAQGQQFVVEAGCSFEIGDAKVTPFPAYHDSCDCVGYVVEDKITGQRVGLATDTGCFDQGMVDALHGCELLIIESNHDPEMLAKGPYPSFLKRRIAGEKGHLSNQSGADLAGKAISSRTECIWLAHLSIENNDPELALATMQRVLERQLERGQDLPEISVVPRAMLGPVYPKERISPLF
jgi:phosphoribosyl 1,2-cyclic phosphodiesterase